MTKAGSSSRPLSNGEEQAPHSGSVIVIMFGWRSTCANPLARQLFHQNSPDRMLYAPGPDCVIAGKPWNHSARPGLRDIFIHRPADRPGMGHDLRWGIWAIEFICLVAAIWLSYLLMKKLWGVFPALCGIAVWLFGLNITLQGGNSTEEFPLVLHYAALILFIRLVESPVRYRDGLVLGLVFSISFLFRANNAMVETAIVLTLLVIWIIEKQFRTVAIQLTWMAIGALGPLLVTALYFGVQGIFNEMFDASLTYNLLYSGTRFTGTPALTAGFQILGAVAWIGLVGYGIVLWHLIRGWRAGIKPSPILLLLLIGCPLAVLASDPAQRSYPHYFINWLPFVALLSALTFRTVQELMPVFNGARPAEYVYPGISLLITTALFFRGGLAEKNYTAFANLLTRSDVQRQSIISAYVENDTKPGDLVLFWGGFPAENLMAHRAAPTPYITYPLLIESTASERLSDQFLLDLMKNRPVLIVDLDQSKVLSLDPQKRAAQLAANLELPDLPANIDEVFKFIDANYHSETAFRNATVYRLNGTVAP